ncbi:hypothetical protein CEQ90_19730 [Lewinellaceae bacterium SD302]|nr:hypothetical protein CEQ90_19730 [Lewinellaceae bacterium SD302]
MRLTIFITLLFLIYGSVIQAQAMSPLPPGADAAPSATAVRFPESIQLDGKLDEPFWQLSQPATAFWETFPTDTIRSPYQTEIYFGYDDDFLYVGSKCYTPGQDYVITSLRRDYSAGGNDNLTFVFNTFNDKTNAIVFGMNPVGVNREALIYNGGEDGDDFRDEWDNKWRGESYIGDGFWSSELKIPFSSLRFPAGAREWFFNSYRFDTQSNTRSTWHRIPQNQMIMSLAYMGKVTFTGDPPQRRGSGFTVIPYVGGSVSQDFEEKTGTDWDGNVGADAKIAIGSNLNLDLTVNPDFSQVEVDQQVINTSRFELFFPERRQFFLENADLFGSFGFGRINPFFSRRIGVTRDTTTGEAIQNPIYAGARLSGRLDKNWRVGLLNMQAASNVKNGLPSYNYGVAAVQRRIGARSNVGIIMVNKENLTGFSDSTGTNADYNRVVGLDYNLATADNKWNGKTFVHKSITPGDDDKSLSHGLNLEYRSRNWNFGYEHSTVGENYDAEVGFVPRKGYFNTSAYGSYTAYPENPQVVERGPSISSEFFFDPVEGQTDRSFGLDYNWRYGNTSSFGVATNYDYIFLLNDFDPTRTDATPLPGNQGYGFWSLELNWDTDSRKKLSGGITPTTGQFFNGYTYGIGGNLLYRYQPYGSINLRFSYRYIDLPEPYASTALFLIGPRIDLTFTKSLFLTTFIQYNDQIDNINLNARLQWRFAPVSDFFLVYTDNYDSLELGVKNRAVVAKVTYWLNL